MTTFIRSGELNEQKYEKVGTTTRVVGSGGCAAPASKGRERAWWAAGVISGAELIGEIANLWKSEFVEIGCICGRGLSLGEGCPRFVLKVRLSIFLGFLLSKRYFDAFTARGKLPINSVFHSKACSLLYVGIPRRPSKIRGADGQAPQALRRRQIG